jgi:hypothetical protein
METVEELQKFQNEMRDKIKTRAKELNFDPNRVEPIFDGVCDIEQYLSSSPKIMWILKEAYDSWDDQGPVGGGWEIFNDWAKPEKFDSVTSNKTWNPMMYILNGIKNGEKWDDMSWTWQDPNMLKLLTGSAYINLSKMPGYSKSGDMVDKFNAWQDIVLEQIEGYAPDVIIFGNTLNNIWQSPLCDNGDATRLEVDEKVGVYRNKKGQLLIDAYHPNQKRLKQHAYVDSIVAMVRKYFAK